MRSRLTVCDEDCWVETTAVTLRAEHVIGTDRLVADPVQTATVRSDQTISSDPPGGPHLISTLLAQVLEAHGGARRWHAVSAIHARVQAGGFLPRTRWPGSRFADYHL